MLSISPSRRKLLRRIAIALLLLYTVGTGFIWWAMRQPPERFGRIMAKLPGPVPFLLFPFETLWLRARAGNLQVGEAAPDFALMRQDKSGAVRLSALTAQQPAVLVFGSYT